MRRNASPSEVRRLAAPLALAVDAAWQRMHWWITIMVVLYAVSGTTVVRPDEVAVVLRWGRLVGDTPALQEHGPGLLFSLPRPIDQVVRVPVKRVREVRVDTLTPAGPDDLGAVTLDPITQGYAVTGDQNIVHAVVVARYRVRDAADWSFYGPVADDVLRVEVTAALVRSIGEMGVDRVLADGRKDLVAMASRRAQEGLDRSHSGLELSSLELTRLSPPAALANDFNAVQSAFIAAETKRKDAQAYAESVIPQAQGEADTTTQQVRGIAENDLANARGEAAAFTALAREYQHDPAVVRERLYRDGIEQAIQRAGSVRWIPPPTGAKYDGFRISLSSGSPVAAPLSQQEDEP